MRFLPVILLFLVMFSGCSFNTERDNALDSKSGNYQPYGDISGQITRKDNITPIPDAVIDILPNAIATTSDINGEFQFDNITVGDLSLEITHPQYKSLGYPFTLSAGQSAFLNFQMDANSVFDSVSVTSQKLMNEYLNFDYDMWLQVYAQISDIDGSSDLDSSLIFAYWNGMSDSLNKNSATVYSVYLDSSSFPNYTIQYMLDVPFEIIMVDKYSDTTFAPSAQLHRVIDLSIKHIDPDLGKGTGGVGSNPTFSWEMPNEPINFNYRYRFKVYFDDYNRTLRYQTVLYDTSEALVIDPPLNRYYYTLSEDTLTIQEYFWTIQLEDIYGDFTRSEEVSFYVQ